MNDYIQDPMYVWLCARQKELERELDQTNRRMARKKDELRWALRDIKDRKSKMRGEKPKFTDYGMF